MPTYNYKCEKCGKRSNVIQSIKDVPLIECDLCGGEVNRIISGGSGMIFKGTGFYLTDYARKSDKNISDDKEKSPTTKKKKQKQRKKEI